MYISAYCALQLIDFIFVSHVIDFSVIISFIMYKYRLVDNAFNATTENEMQMIL